MPRCCARIEAVGWAPPRAPRPGHQGSRCSGPCCGCGCCGELRRRRCGRRGAGRPVRGGRAGRGRRSRWRSARQRAQAGGRCRSYHDPQLGADDRQRQPSRPVGQSRRCALPRTDRRDRRRWPAPTDADFAFADLTTGERWTVRLNDGPLPWWMLSPGRRVPGTRIGDYLRARCACCDGARPADRRAYRHERPGLGAAARTGPARRAQHRAGGGIGARSRRDVLRETLAKGGAAMRPRIAEPTLAAAFIDPGARLAGSARRAASARPAAARARASTATASPALDWGDGVEPVAPDEPVILAVPPWVAADAGARACRARRIPRDRQRAFRHAAAGRHTADARRDRRHGRMGVRLPRSPVGDGQRRRPAGRRGPRGARADVLGRYRAALGIDLPPTAALADRQGEARDLRRHARAGRQAPAGARRAGATCSWPATGRRPACPRRSKARCARAKPRRAWRSAIGRGV